MEGLTTHRGGGSQAGNGALSLGSEVSSRAVMASTPILKTGEEERAALRASEPQYFLLWKRAINASKVFLWFVSDSEAQAGCTLDRVGWARTG